MTDVPPRSATPEPITAPFYLKLCSSCFAYHRSAKLTRFCPACGGEDATNRVLPEQPSDDPFDTWDRIGAAFYAITEQTDVPRTRMCPDPSVHHGSVPQSEPPALDGAVGEWFASHCPVDWTEDEHLANPIVNMTTDTEQALALAYVAALRPTPEADQG